jgi:DNA-binding response OmpR family regulator
MERLEMNESAIMAQIKECAVLYVEDDPFQRDQTRAILSMFFSRVICAEDGTEGLALYKKSPFDLVITDILLPKLSGTELAEAIRHINPTQEIVFVSSSRDLDDFKKAIRLRVLDFLIKPYTFEDLKTILLTFGDKRSDETARIVYFNESVGYHTLKHCAILGEREIELTPKEQKLLELAMHHRHQVITYDQISAALSNEDTNLTSIKNIVFRLRKKLDSDIFTNLPSVGYRVV